MGFRTDLRAGCKTVIDTYAVANPTLLPHTYDHPPEAPRTPCAWVEKAMPEEYQHTSGIRFRRARVGIVVLNRMISSDQATDEQDALLDGLLDAFTADPDAAGANTLIEPIANEDIELAIGDAIYAGFRLTVTGLIQQGRN